MSDKPSRPLVTDELVFYLAALKLVSPRKRKPFTAEMIRHARDNNRLKAVQPGRDYIYMPDDVAEWIAGGCQTGEGE